jgi:periplasmic protein CpxP/Spy
MKLKSLALLTSLVALTLTTATLRVQAQPAFPEMPPAVREAMSALNLTDAQKEQLAGIRAETRSQMAAILAPEQQQALQNAIAQGQPLREAIQAINLTPEQKQQMRSIFQSTRGQVSDILTDEQRQQLHQQLNSRREQRVPRLSH